MEGRGAESRFFFAGSQRSWDRLSSAPQEPVAATGSSSGEMASPREQDLGRSNSGTFISDGTGGIGRGGMSLSGGFGAGSAGGSRNDGSEFRQRLKELGIGVDKGFSPASQALDLSSSWVRPSQSEASASRTASPSRFESRGADVGIASTLGLGLSGSEWQPPMPATQTTMMEVAGPNGRNMSDSGPWSSTASARAGTMLAGNGSVKDLGPPARGWEQSPAPLHYEQPKTLPQVPPLSTSTSTPLVSDGTLSHPSFPEYQHDDPHDHHHHRHQHGRPQGDDAAYHQQQHQQQHQHQHRHQQGDSDRRLGSRPSSEHSNNRLSLASQQQRLLQEPRPASPPPEEQMQQQSQQQSQQQFQQQQQQQQQQPPQQAQLQQQQQQQQQLQQQQHHLEHQQRQQQLLQQEQELQWQRRQQQDQHLQEQQGAPDSGGAPGDEITSLGRMESEVHRSQIRLLREQVQALTREVIKLDKDMMQMKSSGGSGGGEGGGGGGGGGGGAAGAAGAAGGGVSPEMQSEGAAYIQGLEDRIIALEKACSPDSRGEEVLEDLGQRMQETWKKLNAKQDIVEQRTAQDLDLLRRKVQQIEDLQTAKAPQLEESSRVDKLQDAVGQLDALLRKDIEERMTEDKRLWSAIENHTHDLDVSALCLDQHSGRWQEYSAAHEPVQNWSPSQRGGRDTGPAGAVRLAAPGASETSVSEAAHLSGAYSGDRLGSGGGCGGGSGDVGRASASASGSVTVLDPPRVVNSVSFRS